MVVVVQGQFHVQPNFGVELWLSWRCDKTRYQDDTGPVELGHGVPENNDSDLRIIWLNVDCSAWTRSI